jgi:hypothetical protein
VVWLLRRSLPPARAAVSAPRKTTISR